MFNLTRTLVDAAPNAQPNNGVHLPLYQPAAGGAWWGNQGQPSLQFEHVNLDPLNRMLDSFFQQNLPPNLPQQPLRPMPRTELWAAGNRVGVAFSLPAAAIVGLNAPAGLCAEFDSGGMHPGGYTNEFLLVLEVTRGKSKLVTLYPLG